MLYTSRLHNEPKNQLFISILIFLIVLFHFLDFAFFWCSAVIRFSNQYLNFFAFFFPSSPFFKRPVRLKDCIFLFCNSGTKEVLMKRGKYFLNELNELNHWISTRNVMQ